MKAFGAQSSSIASIIEFETPDPTPAADELLVEIKAISINPVDTKIRKNLGENPLPTPRILGFDASGIVRATGHSVTNFTPGDEIYYAGDVTRPGTNSELHTVQAALVSKKPTNLTYSQAAAIPLVGITAYELLHERMLSGAIPQPCTPILIIGAAGGVGSALIPLAKLAGLTIVATASRPESSAWCKSLGADHVIDHHLALAPQCKHLGITHFPLIANLYSTEKYWQQTAELLAPLGTLGLIVETSQPINIGNPLRLKSPRIVWEYMPSRAMFQTPDLAQQGHILTKLAHLSEAGAFPLIATAHLGPITAANLQNAHTLIETSSTLGKITLGD